MSQNRQFCKYKKTLSLSKICDRNKIKIPVGVLNWLLLHRRMIEKYRQKLLIGFLNLVKIQQETYLDFPSNFLTLFSRMEQCHEKIWRKPSTITRSKRNRLASIPPNRTQDLWEKLRWFYIFNLSMTIVKRFSLHFFQTNFINSHLNSQKNYNFRKFH